MSVPLTWSHTHFRYLLAAAYSSPFLNFLTQAPAGVRGTPEEHAGEGTY